MSLSRGAVVVALGALSLVGCAGGGASGDGDGDGGGGIPDAGGGEGGDPIDNQDDCADESKLIYLSGYGERASPEELPPVTLSVFDMQSLAITEVGTIDCEGASTPGTSVAPKGFAMDRDGYGWALFGVSTYEDAIYRVRLSDGDCDPNRYLIPDQGFDITSIAWARASADSDDEVLYVSGWPRSGSRGQPDFVLGEPSIAVLDLATLELTDIRPIAFVNAGVRPYVEIGEDVTRALSMKLTPNSDGELWGFVANQLPKFVYQVDTSTGATTEAFDVAAVRPLATQHGIDNGPIISWGGNFYLFHNRGGAVLPGEEADPRKSIFKLDPSTGDLSQVLDISDTDIGTVTVSSCAPPIIL